VSNERGFTLVELLVAVVILAVGILALVGSTASVTRMIGSGKHTTNATLVAERRLEALRHQALGSTPLCGTLASGSATGVGYSERWTVSGTGDARTLSAQVIYQDQPGLDTLALTTMIRC
jgi:type II secretion system protein I